MNPELIPVSELEQFGCPVSVINSLEEKSGICWLSQLLQLSPKELSAVPQLGNKRQGLLIAAVRKHREVYGW